MPKKKRKKTSRLSPEETAKRREQRSFRNSIRRVFTTAGFTSIPCADQQINFKGRDAEFDWIFVYENVVVVAEDTCAAKSSDIRDHLNKKALFYQQLQQNKNEFIDFLVCTFGDFERAKKQEYDAADFRVIFAYCSKHPLEDSHKSQFRDSIVFVEEKHLYYFGALAKTIGKSMRFEMFKFLGLGTGDVGVGVGDGSTTYSGFILPESPSGFPQGYKVVTVYADPASIMEVSYVLRKDGWREGDGLYQRMISQRKIGSMRRYLSDDQRVFINNVIVSFPASTRVLDSKDRDVDLSKVSKTTAVRVKVSKEYNSIGIIDGQHRLFAYHEGSDLYETTIAAKRVKQQLLITGVVYPENLSEDRQREFEAKLFLEINDKQTKTRAGLRQAIEAIVNPFSTIAVARAVVNKMASDGPLCGILEQHEFDRGKLKSSSIVSYGLRHIIKSDGNDVLFRYWSHPDKHKMAKAMSATSRESQHGNKPSKAALMDYVNFCHREINNLVVGYKIQCGPMWTLDRQKSRALSATAINGLIFCLRKLLETDTPRSMEVCKGALKKLDVDFTPKKFRFKSSHWREFGSKIAKDCFGV